MASMLNRSFLLPFTRAMSRDQIAISIAIQAT
jgi:hypothetical protein